MNKEEQTKIIIELSEALIKTRNTLAQYERDVKENKNWEDFSPREEFMQYLLAYLNTIKIPATIEVARAL